ncbi:MAG: segregation/condensation protein A [Moraxella sp.]|nr:segregation/condensation protein A [Moraxella sp.]
MYQLSIRLYDTEVQALPDDLYIPPEAFAVWIEQFEGPLDFLLYLVKKNNFDISTTALLPITEQYLTYIKELDESHFELAGDYLLMASTLIAIKSELLLPTPKTETDNEQNPTKKLIRRLEEYAQIKTAAGRLDKLIRLERDVFLAYASLPDPADIARHIPPYPATLLIDSLIKMQIKPDYQMHHIKADSIPLADRMAAISRILASRGQGVFSDVLDKTQGKLGVVVSFVAILELAKQRLLEFQLKDDAPDNLELSALELIWVGKPAFVL